MSKRDTAESIALATRTCYGRAIGRAGVAGRPCIRPENCGVAIEKTPDTFDDRLPLIGGRSIPLTGGYVCPLPDEIDPLWQDFSDIDDGQEAE